AGMAALRRLLGRPLAQTLFWKAPRPQAQAAGRRLTQAPGPQPPLRHARCGQTERPLPVPAQGRAAGPAAVDALQRMVRASLRARLRSMGLLAAAAIAAWQQQVKMPAIYGRWLEESSRILAGQG